MRKPHKHADLIKAWADGKNIEYKDYEGNWVDASCPSWNPACEYRIKPEPKPDYVIYYLFYKGSMCVISNLSPANLKLTFDGETGKLKAAEVI